MFFANLRLGTRAKLGFFEKYVKVVFRRELIDLYVYSTDTHVVTVGNRKGFAMHLTLICAKCHSELGSAFLSPVLATGTNPQPFVINDIMVLLFNHLGLGYTAMKVFSAVLGTPAMHLKTFQEEEKKVIAKTVDVANVAEVVSALHRSTNPGDEEDGLILITFSFDGTWQK